ncbi:hypothetical protein G4B88_015321 [Cannabis sativa]|uniref:DUF4283 domain-containing protein n=1 Tax=Cannabis sativa TaxID=3483 RepID=A0A7J6DY31_CANSA|nr:hypothetical protein G4B88_015321 [Cannabis sativa]
MQQWLSIVLLQSFAARRKEKKRRGLMLGSDEEKRAAARKWLLRLEIMASSSVAIRDLEDGYADISIEGEDDGDLGVDFLVPDDQAGHDHLCIVGRFLIARPIDFEAMRHFYHEIDLERVVEGSPWTFNRQQFVFRRLQRGDDPKKVVINHLDMWVQIHGLQTSFKSASVVERLGGFVGTFIKLDPKNFQHVWREYMRVRKLRRSVDDPGLNPGGGIIWLGRSGCVMVLNRTWRLLAGVTVRQRQWGRFSARPNSMEFVGEDSGFGCTTRRESADIFSAPKNKEQTVGIDGKADFVLNDDNSNIMDELEDGLIVSLCLIQNDDVW